jgi:small neutral amino acid transporter SnatA (MarC family)
LCCPKWAATIYATWINWLAMRHSKSIIEAIGPTPLQLLGAVFGVLQTTLGIEFILDAYRML